jgi:hypothetical protein
MLLNPRIYNNIKAKMMRVIKIINESNLALLWLQGKKKGRLS